jgi:hypothetical protein
MRSSPISRSSRSGRFSRKPTQFVWRKAAADETDKVHKQRQSLSVMSCRDVHIDDAYGRIPEHITREGLALDGD